MKDKTNKALTWEELADEYNKSTGGHARTKSMEDIFDWAESQSDKFTVSKEGAIFFAKVGMEG